MHPYLLAMAVVMAPPTTTETSFRKAREVLNAALDAAGGADALRAVKDVSRVGRGTAFNLGQSLRPDAPYTQRPIEVATTVDFGRRWSMTETATTTAGNLPTRVRTVFKSDSGFGFNHVTSVLTPTTPAGLTAARNALARDPITLLLTAAGRAETLRYLGEATLDGRPQRVITFADEGGAQIALYIDAQTHLLSKQETAADNPVLGDVVNEVLFLDHRRIGAVSVPFRLLTRTGGEVTQDLAYSEIKLNGGVSDASFEEPSGAVRVSPPPSGAPRAKANAIGRDAYFVDGGTHNSLFVVFSDHVLLIEAPQSVERTQAVLGAIREVAGDKPVRYVVPTHYHFDHSGGLRAAVAAGATVVTTPGNRAFVERLAAAPRVMRPDALSRGAKKATVETFSGKRVFTDGTHTVELYDVGPSPHVDEVLVAYLPQEKVVFVADLFGVPSEGPLPPAGATAREFAQKLKTLGLSVERIAPGHGRLGTMEELSAALAKPAP